MSRLARPLITKEDVVENLRAKAKRDGVRKLSVDEIMDDPQCVSPWMITKFYPDVHAAMRAAGLYPMMPNDEDLIRSLVEFREEHGRPPTEMDCELGTLPYTHGTYAAHFGSWNAALEAAGMKTRRWTRGYTDEVREEIAEEIVAKARELYGEGGVLPYMHEFFEATGFTVNVIRKHVGSYGELAERTGMQLLSKIVPPVGRRGARKKDDS